MFTLNKNTSKTTLKSWERRDALKQRWRKNAHIGPRAACTLKNLGPRVHAKKPRPACTLKSLGPRAR